MINLFAMNIHAKLLLVLILATIAMDMAAQSSKLIVFAPKGEKFTLYVGGVRQNNEPASRVETEKPGGT